MKSWLLLPVISAILFLAACGGPPADNPLLEEAKSEYSAAEADTAIVQFAPVALKEAEESLELGFELWEEEADKVRIEHQAYLTLQKTAIARETANLNAAQNEIERAEPERQQVLLDIRHTEAQLAENRAQQALEEAQREREAAEQARREAEELARKVDELEARQTQRGLVLTLGDVLFDFDEATLRSGGVRTVAELAGFLDEYPERNVLIEGHTDNIGSEQYNLDLSEKRADAVKQELLNQGIASDRIETKGLGMAHPVASNETSAGRQQNRRVEVIISDQDGAVSER